MTREQVTSLQERIVKEITSTYNSIAQYKDHTNRYVLHNKVIDKPTAERRIQIVEHKLKALKMMLARIDDGQYSFCEKCNKPIPPKKKPLKNPNVRFCADCA